MKNAFFGLDRSMDSFEKLVQQYTPMMYKIMHSLKIYKNLEHFHSIALQALWEACMKYDNCSSSFSTFAYTIIRGRLLNELQIEGRYDKHNVPSVMDLLEFNLDHSYTHNYLIEEADAISQYCEGLTEYQKRWVIHTFLYDHSLDDIAAIYQVAKPVVKSWRRSALDKLRKQLSQK